MTDSARRRYQFRDYLSPRVLTMLALGFSSGLPFNLVGNTLGYWLRDEHSTLKAIGFISWVGIAYSLKFLWAPLLELSSLRGSCSRQQVASTSQPERTGSSISPTGWPNEAQFSLLLPTRRFPGRALARTPRP